MKELPSRLKYVFLEPEKVRLVIISSALTEYEEQKLLETFIKYKETIAWSIKDLKGIGPSICMHKILLKDNAKTSIEHQRRLNLVMKEVVKKGRTEMAKFRFYICNLIQPLGEPSSCGSQERWIYCNQK